MYTYRFTILCFFPNLSLVLSALTLAENILCVGATQYIPLSLFRLSLNLTPCLVTLSLFNRYVLFCQFLVKIGGGDKIWVTRANIR